MRESGFINKEPVDTERLGKSEKPGRFEYKNIPVTNRSAVLYYRLFNLSDNEDISKYFKDKTVLDLGAGKGEFVGDLLNKKITSEAYAIDFLYHIIPDDTEEEYHDKYTTEPSKPPPKDHRITARIDEIPAKDKSIDIAVAEASSPLHADHKEDISDFFNEIVRILKPGGEARIHPINKFVSWMAGRHDTFLEKILNKGALPKTMESTCKNEMERLGFLSIEEYRNFLKDKYNKAEKWTQECIGELRKNPDIYIEIATTEIYNPPPGLKKVNDILIIRKK